MTGSYQVFGPVVKFMGFSPMTDQIHAGLGMTCGYQVFDSDH
jgi:hypothetical protein